MELNQSLTIINDMKKLGLKIGFTCSSFDLLHSGHYLMLDEAKSKCDFLVAGLQTDPSIDIDYRMQTDGKNKNNPVQSYEERYIQLNGCKYIDLIIKYETEADLYILLQAVNPDIRILGADWQGKKYTGHDLPIPVYFNSRNHSYSTSNLRKRVYEAELERLNTNL